ncbi:MAG: LacI family DNA-binding transcriptional regulator [Rhodobacteraceae bacterium]|nr:LacI family DNA-binding transcriptional regulator [Paracoccaceae bacterium]
MRRPTLNDVARAAGVSYATADRVLNNRGSVSGKSRRRVQQAIADLGYVRDQQAANLSRRRQFQFRFILPIGNHSFFQALHAAVAEEAPVQRGDRVDLSIVGTPALNADAQAAALDAVGEDCDCVAVVATRTERVTAAIRALDARGIGVITLVSDAAPEVRRAYIGIDNRTAGRTAGRLMEIAHGARAGLVLPIVGALQASDHSDRLDGLHDALAGTMPAIEILPAISVQDRADLMRDMLPRALAARPDISGIYSIGAGNRGLLEVLARHRGPRPFTIVHELTPVTREGLSGGLFDAVIDQKPAQEVRRAIEVMKAIATGNAWRDPARDITPAIYVKENMPLEGGSPRAL